VVARRMVGIRLLRVGCPGGNIMQLMTTSKDVETVKNWTVRGNIGIRELMEENEWWRRTFVAKHGVIVWCQRPKRFFCRIEIYSLQLRIIASP
jgi:hypothetical protein